MSSTHTKLRKLVYARTALQKSLKKKKKTWDASDSILGEVSILCLHSEAFFSFCEQHPRTYEPTPTYGSVVYAPTAAQKAFFGKKKKRVHMHHLAHLQSRAFWPWLGLWGPTRVNTFWLLERPNRTSRNFFENLGWQNFCFVMLMPPSKF